MTEQGTPPSSIESTRHRRDRVGRVSVQVFDELGVPPDADFYICGPAAFMSGLVADLAGRGVARDRLRTEKFGAGPSMTSNIVPVRYTSLPPGFTAMVGPHPKQPPPKTDG